MRILYIGDARSVHTRRWVNFFADHAYEVFLFSSFEIVEDFSKNLKFFIFPKKNTGNELLSFIYNAFSELIRIKTLINEIRPDLIHIHYINSDAFLATIVADCPVIVTPWGSDILIAPKNSRLKKWLAQFVLKQASLITCDAYHITEPLVALGTAPEKIKLVFFGTDTEKFQPHDKNVKIMDSLDARDKKIIISVRSLSIIYSIDTLIRAIPIVIGLFPNSVFIIAGSGSEEQNLKNLAKDLGVLRNIRFIGQIRPDDLPQYLTSSDIYVSTSTSDAGLSASTAEAMACGLPVIITEFGDNPIWVKDGKNGFLIPVKNSNILAEKIIYLLSHENERFAMGQANRDLILKKNNFYKEMDKMGNIYTQTAKKSKL